jgi:4'-phosphopantetheinyl transferase
MSIAVVKVAPVAAVCALLPAALEWLSPSERERHARFQRQARRDQYLAGHWLARQMIAARCGGSARDWVLQEQANRPPAIVGASETLKISLSHSGEWVACALSSAAIGIDLEQREPPRAALRRVAALLLAGDEAPSQLSDDQLLARWVAKEAWIKRFELSALPAQLAAISLIKADALSGNVRVQRYPAFYLSIATERAASVSIHAIDAGRCDEAWWCVS